MLINILQAKLEVFFTITRSLLSVSLNLHPFVHFVIMINPHTVFRKTNDAMKIIITIFSNLSIFFDSFIVDVLELLVHPEVADGDYPSHLISHLV
jgi:hypothetical protein